MISQRIIMQLSDNSSNFIILVQNIDKSMKKNYNQFKNRIKTQGRGGLLAYKGELLRE